MHWVKYVLRAILYIIYGEWVVEKVMRETLWLFIPCSLVPGLFC